MIRILSAKREGSFCKIFWFVAFGWRSFWSFIPVSCRLNSVSSLLPFIVILTLMTCELRWAVTLKSARTDLILRYCPQGTISANRRMARHPLSALLLVCLWACIITSLLALQYTTQPTHSIDDGTLLRCWAKNVTLKLSVFQHHNARPEACLTRIIGIISTSRYCLKSKKLSFHVRNIQTAENVSIQIWHELGHCNTRV